MINIFFSIIWILVLILFPFLYIKMGSDDMHSIITLHIILTLYFIILLHTKKRKIENIYEKEMKIENIYEKKNTKILSGCHCRADRT